MAEKFSSCDEEKITKGLGHCEEGPAPCVISNEKCAVFSNSVSISTLPISEQPISERPISRGNYSSKFSIEELEVWIQLFQVVFIRIRNINLNQMTNKGLKEAFLNYIQL
jgi:hypothetical protein